MQSAGFSNRFIVGIVAFGISFGLSLVLNWNFGNAFFTALITVSATYVSIIFSDKRRRNHEMIILDSLKRHIREMETVKSRLVAEINQLESHNSRIYAESKQIQHQLIDCRHQRDSINRELSTYAGQKKQLEAGIDSLSIEISNLEKTKQELEKNFDAITTEHRRLELSCSSSRAELNQIANNIEELLYEQEDLENNLTLLERLKPPLDEKIIQLRSEIHELESQVNKYTGDISEKHSEKLTLEEGIKSLRKKVKANNTEKLQLENQTSLLRDERDLLQNQVWDLLQQIESLNPLTTDIPQVIIDEPSTTESEYHKYDSNQEIESFPFSEILEDTPDEISQKGKQLDSIDSQVNSKLDSEWEKFALQLSQYQIKVLKVIVEEENPQSTIKKICEENITMPNLLIDSINEIAKDNIDELIINTNDEIPRVFDEFLEQVKIIINIYTGEQNLNSTDSQTQGIKPAVN